MTLESDKDRDLISSLLKLNLISNLTQLRQECALMWQIKPTVTSEDMANFVDSMKKRKEYLQDMVSGVLSREDSEQIKKLYDESLNKYFKQFDLQKRKWVEQEI